MAEPKPEVTVEEDKEDIIADPAPFERTDKVLVWRNGFAQMVAAEAAPVQFCSHRNVGDRRAPLAAAPQPSV